MVTGNTKRLSKIARELNVGISTLVDFLGKKGIEISSNPNTKLEHKDVQLLEKEFKQDSDLKEESKKITRPNRSTSKKKEEVETKEDNTEKNSPKEVSSKKAEKKEVKVEKPEEISHKPKIKIVGKIDVDTPKKGKKKTENKPTKAPVTTEKTLEKKDNSTAKKSINNNINNPVEDSNSEAPIPKEKRPNNTSLDKKDSSKYDGKVEKQTKKKEAEPLQDHKDKELQGESSDRMKEDNEKKIAAQNVVKETATKDEQKPKAKEDEIFHIKTKKLTGPTVIGKIELPVEKKNDKSSKDNNQKKKKRKRIRDKEKVDLNNKNQNDNSRTNNNNNKGNHSQGGKRRPGAGNNNDNRSGGNNNNNNNNNRSGGNNNNAQGNRQQGSRGANNNAGVRRGPQANNNNTRGKGKNFNNKRKVVKKEVSEEDVQKQIKDTLARLTSKGGKSKTSKYRKEKRQAISNKMAQEEASAQQEKSVLKVTEFVSVNELATMMDVPVTSVIATCMNLGLFVSINQRLDAETMSLVADEFGYTVEFIAVEVQEAILEEEDKDEDLKPRSPIVTVMGHVDHGKTSLLDYIRKANVIAGEAGGITQHIGAYNVTLESDKKITFLDTPGHEAFTAMRARGAQVTDIAIIIVAADDNVMPQTVEAINHATAAGVPIIFAINKIDKDGADPEKVKGELANMNYLVEDWGGKYQSQEISAKNGIGIQELLEKVLLEAEMLELKANPEKRAVGSIIESSLDKGRGYVSTVLVQAGNLNVGDVILAGQYFGHVKAMFNERNQKVTTVGPSEPALILGLNGAPQAGDKFNAMPNEKEARQIANKREQLQREQGLRTQKHITLDEIGRRIAIGNFQELNVIVKGDVDGSIEALSDSLIKLSTEEIQVNIIHKAVGQISESDVMLATASNAIIVGFQVRPSIGARRLAEKEEIDIRLYSIIYDAIEEVKGAMEGMLSPEIKEEVTATIEVRETFKITKVGTIAGCFVRDGKVTRNSKVRLIRDGIVIYTGELAALKRFKDDVKEVAKGYECGMSIVNYNDIKVEDIIEAYEEVEVAKKL